MYIYDRPVLNAVSRCVWLRVRLCTPVTTRRAPTGSARSARATVRARVWVVSASADPQGAQRRTVILPESPRTATGRGLCGFTRWE